MSSFADLTPNQQRATLKAAASKALADHEARGRPVLMAYAVEAGVPPAPSIVVCGTLNGWALRFAADGELIAEFATSAEAWAALKDARRLALTVAA